MNPRNQQKKLGACDNERAAPFSQVKNITMPIDRDYVILGSGTSIGDQIAAVTAARYDGAKADQPFSWIWGIGTYSLPGLPVKLGDATVAEPKISLAPLEQPLVKLKTYAELANPEDTLVMKIVTWGLDNLATGGYMGHYDERLRQYNDGKLTYKEFANANFADVLTTAYATQVSFDSAGAIISASANAKSLVGKIFGAAAGGAVAGATFDTMLQAGLMEISALSNGQTGQQEFSLSELLVSSGLGFAIGGLGGAAPALFEKIGELIGRDASQKKLAHSEVSDQVPIPVELKTPQGKTSEVRLIDAVPAEITGQTEVRVKDKLVFTTPKADSMTLAQASEWYRGQMNQLAGMIDTTLPLEAQIIQADQLAQELMNGATEGTTGSVLTFQHFQLHIVSWAVRKIEGKNNESDE